MALQVLCIAAEGGIRTMLTIEAGAEAHTGAWRVAAGQSVTQTVTLAGRLHLIRNGELRVMLVDDQGQATRLLIDEALGRPFGGLRTLDRQRVRITGERESGPPEAVRVRSIETTPERQ